MSFYVKENSFYRNDKKVFLNSGEIHYFRIKKELWDRHLEAAKEAGLTTVSTYVPWAFHEPSEGVFDFDGTTRPERDLKAWIEKCQFYGLQCILKPGPFILAEYRGAGLPDWLMDSYATQIKMRNSKGEIFPSDGVSLFHPIYLEKVRLWYNQIMPFIQKYEESNGGPVIMMQVCNEIGVFSWLAHQGDYCDISKEKFIAYLENRFTDIKQVNQLWNTSYVDFNQVELPPDGRIPYDSKADRGRDYEWHLFWRSYYGDYLRMLTKMVHERGVSVPLYHNLPGWIYGSGYEFPVNITMYEDLFEDKSEIIFGVDHIPEFLSYRNMHDDRIINDITYAMQGNKPLFAAEFQSGSREYHVVTNPREMELFYKASVAHGLTGWNYYMFSQGRNTRHTGYSGSTFYWFNPLTPEAEKTNAFPLVQRMNKIIACSEDIIVNAQRKAEVCVLFYPPYYATELERPVSTACELTFNYSAIRRPAYFDGLLKVLQVLNIDYNMLDATKVKPADLQNYKQVWSFTTDEMNARDQQVLVDYTKNGSHLVIFPHLPDREMNQTPCTILRDAISVYPSGIEVIDSPLIDVYENKDIKCANPQVIYSEEALQGAEIIARNIKGSACGFSKKLGKGTLTHLGTWIGFDTEGHKPVYEDLLSKSSANLRQATSSTDNIAVRERFTNDQSGLLMVANYYNEEQTGKISYSHPATEEKISIPLRGSFISIPPIYGILTPLNKKLSQGINLLHTTSDLLNIEISDKQIKMVIQGDRDLLGEMAFEGIDLEKIKAITLNGVNIQLESEGARKYVSYVHRYKCEMNLVINL